jgi:hypothetical protein
VTPHSHDACGDDERVWYPQMIVCRVEMETASALAAYRRLHEKRPWHDGTFTDWAEEQSESHPFHFDHGIRIWVTETDHGLGGHFTRFENPFRKTDDDEEDPRGKSS